ncbi:MAG: TIGR03915 family putative DNA repair protein [Lachnotalea sp.]
MNNKIYICEDSIEGIFTGVYNAWESKYPKEYIKLTNDFESNYELFSEYTNVVTDFDKAKKVARTLQNRFGVEVYTSIYQAACSNQNDKADAIFKTINVGLSSKIPHKLMENLNNQDICRVFELNRAVSNEQSHLLGFVRFKELYNHILCSIIEPKNNVISMIAPHFADRLPSENWMIYDKGRKVAVVHEKNAGWGIIKSDKLNLEMLENVSEEEAQFEILWKGFCRSISIKERENIKLQNQNLPLRFQKNMTEFN